jgi:thiol-disulfide isomerase/thioredoxin
VSARRTLVLALCLPLWLGVAQAGAVERGQVAPAIDLPLFSTQGESGASMSLAELRGKVVYLDFWASWCPPCRMSFPQLEQLRVELAPRGFEVLAVNVDEFEADALKFLEEIPVSYPVVHDAAGLSPQAYGILGMPTGYLIDREGVIRLVHQGFRRNDGAKLKVEIIKLLGE